MEAFELGQRIRAIQHIVEAAAESEEDYRPLLDTLIPAAEFMTREELLEELKRVCAAFDRQRLDAITTRAQAKQTQENLEQELGLVRSDFNKLKQTLADKDAALADKEAALADKDAEIAKLKTQLADSQHSEASLKQEKFGGKSKRGIEKSKTTCKGRDDDKDDFDGTPGSGCQSDSGRDNTDDVAMSLDELRKSKASRRQSYNLADASEKRIYECDETQIPEGAEIIGETEEVIIDEIKSILAKVYKFITYRIKEEYEDEDGNMQARYREFTMHFPKRKNYAADAKLPEPVRKRQGLLPDQVPGTHWTPAMISDLLLQHYYCDTAMNRISNAFRQYGFKIGRSSLELIDSTVAGLLKPLYNTLQDTVLCKNAVLFCDETWYRLHLKDVTKKVYFWILANKKQDATVYVYDNGSRGRKVLTSLLEGRDIKAIHTDGYNAYYYLQGIGIQHIGCAAHLWRYLKDWYERTKDPQAKALLLDLGELFTMEAVLRESEAPPEEVLQRRNSPKTLDTISRFTARVELLLEQCHEIPKIGFRALNYAKEMSSKVFRWREDADYALDNNFAERSARPIATSRKTTMFHGSHSGCENDCIIRSFMETCRRRGVYFFQWLRAYLYATIQGRTDYPNLMPGVLPLG